LRYWSSVEKKRGLWGFTELHQRITKHMRTPLRFKTAFLSTVLVFCTSISQIKPTITIIAGDNEPVLKRRFTAVLETVLLEMNRLKKGTGNLESIQGYFEPPAFQVFRDFVIKNQAYTAGKSFAPQMVQRQGGAFYDIRSIRVKVNLGDTEASDIHSLVFSFSREGRIVSVRAALQNLDYDAVLARGTSLQDSLTLRRILDFLEQFRIAYNTKNFGFLEQVYSDDALIIVGTVLQKKEGNDDFMRGTFLPRAKVKLIQLTKQQYMEGLRNRAFKSNAFLNVRFDDIQIVQHEKIPFIYGISCQQEWKSSSYSDHGYLFLMMDFRNEAEPVIHVRTWQPQPFEDGTYVSLYDFDVVQYKQ